MNKKKIKFKNKNYLLFGFFYLISIGIVAQEKKLNKAHNLFHQYEYAEAIPIYEKLLSKSDAGFNEEVYRKLAEAYYYTSDWDKAVQNYARLEKSTTKLFSNDIFKYVQALKATGNSFVANGLVNAYIEIPEHKTDSLFSTIKNTVSPVRIVYGNYQIQELDFNSPYADITPAFYKNGLVFASSRDTSSISKREHGWNAQPFLNLYHVTANPDYDTFNIPKELSDILNKKWHESSPVFTQDGNTLYYTRNSEKSPKNNNVSRLMLYKATFNSDLKWIEEKLPFNDMTFSNAHPALSLDGTILYFSSDRPGGFGSTDIYRVAIHNDGTYGIPENLGSKINTTSHDSFPFVSREGYLFFASNGHSGFGALDIFVTDLAENLNNMLIFNLGETINTAQDDFALILNSAKGIGFMTSNRPGGKGSDDIYKIKVLESIKLAQAFEGIVLNRKDRTIIPNAKLEVLDAMGNILATTTSDAKARFNFLLSTNLKEIKIRATKEKYYETLESFDKIALKSDELVLLMDPEIDLALELQLDPIYFDFDKATITNRSKKTLDILVRYLNENQGLHIQVRSHTDSRGNDKYNFELSDRRAFSTKAYLEQRGIKADRISSKGFGESELKNDCKNGSFCSDKDHLFNRRSEFIISNKL